MLYKDATPVVASPEDIARYVHELSSEQYADFLNELGRQYYLESCPKHFIARVREDLDENAENLLAKLLPEVVIL